MFKKSWINILASLLLFAATTVTIVLSMGFINKFWNIFTGIDTLIFSVLFGLKTKSKPTKNPIIQLFYDSPPIIGEWEAEGFSNFFENDDVRFRKKFMTIQMKQTYVFSIKNNKIQMEIKKDGLHNKTNSSDVHQLDNGMFAVNFETTSFSTDLQLKTENPTHKGSGTLHFDNASGDLIYEYWTNRFSNGSLRLKRK